MPCGQPFTPEFLGEKVGRKVLSPNQGNNDE
jgi:hypothetical protein